MVQSPAIVRHPTTPTTPFGCCYYLLALVLLLLVSSCLVLTRPLAFLDAPPQSLIPFSKTRIQVPRSRPLLCSTALDTMGDSHGFVADEKTVAGSSKSSRPATNGARYMQTSGSNVVLVRRLKRKDEGLWKPLARWFVENQVGTLFYCLVLVFCCFVTSPSLVGRNMVPVATLA